MVGEGQSDEGLPTRSASGETVLFNPEGRIDSDIPCRSCGYSLRGLTEEAACPECGSPVGASIRGDLLSIADPAWLGALRWGMTLALWAILIEVVAWVLGRVVVVATMGAPKAAEHAEIVATLIGTFATIVWLVAVWRITTPDPATAEGTEARTTPRTLARWLPLTGWVLELATLTMVLAPINTTTFSVATVSASVTGALCATIGFIALLIYLCRLARRAARDELAKQTRVAGWGYFLSIAAVLAGLLSLGLFMGATGMAGGAMWPIGCVFIVLGLCALIFFIRLIVAGFRYRRMFAECQASAIEFRRLVEAGTISA